MQSYYCARVNGHDDDHAASREVRWPKRADYKPKTCKCHSADLYAALTFCPHCGHHSFDSYAEACERRHCGGIGSAA
jgi:hypothetical protein